MPKILMDALVQDMPLGDVLVFVGCFLMWALGFVAGKAP